MREKNRFGFGTLAAKTYTDGKRSNRPLSIPIQQAVNFEAATSEEHSVRFKARSDEFYLRFGHPTSRAAGQKVAELEGAEAGLVFSSGMGAITTTLLALSGGAGSHILAQRQLFGQTYAFLSTVLARHGIEVSYVDAGEFHDPSRHIRTNTSLVYIETPSNPLLRITDIEAAAKATIPRGIPLVVDSTFASPALQKPIDHGASIVVHSATKYLSGHFDLMCGACAGAADLVARVAAMQELLGTVLDPHAAWLLLRGIKTLNLRVPKQSESALTVAEYLERSEYVERVDYPFLPGSSDAVFARHQMRGGGGVVCFMPRGGVAAARRFLDALQLITIATSLGGTETVIEIPGDLDWNERELGKACAHTDIPAGFIRLSLGLEDLPDILADLENGLQAVKRSIHAAVVA